MSTLAVVSQSGETLSFYDEHGKRTDHLTGLTAEPHELCYDDRTNLLYISHAYSYGWYPEHGDFVREISVLDCSQRRVVETIDVRPMGGTHYLALDKKRDILYASVEDGISDHVNAGGIIGIGLKSRKIVKAIESGHKTHWFVMTPGGERAFTCNKEAGYVSVIDLLTEHLVCKIDMPGGCEQPGISNDGKLAYFPTPCMVNAAKDPSAEISIKVIDAALARVVETIPLDTAAVSIHVESQDRIIVGQFRMALDDSGRRTNEGGGVTVFASAANGHAKIAFVETGEVPLTIFSSPDGKRAYVANIFKGTVNFIDLETMEVERTLNVDLVHRADKKFHNGAHGMALVP